MGGAEGAEVVLEALPAVAGQAHHQLGVGEVLSS